MVMISEPRCSVVKYHFNQTFKHTAFYVEAMRSDYSVKMG